MLTIKCELEVTATLWGDVTWADRLPLRLVMSAHANGELMADHYCRSGVTRRGDFQDVNGNDGGYGLRGQHNSSRGPCVSKVTRRLVVGSARELHEGH